MEDPRTFETWLERKAILVMDDSDEMAKRYAGIPFHPDPIVSMRPPDGSEYRKKYLFRNGYAISVVRGMGTFGAGEVLFEMAVMSIVAMQTTNGVLGEGTLKLCFDSGITDDVVGYLTSREVLSYAERIHSLPPLYSRGENLRAFLEQQSEGVV